MKENSKAFLSNNNLNVDNNILLQAREYFDKNDFKNAATLYNKIFSQQPDNLEAGSRLSTIMIYSGQIEVAEKILTHLLSIFPNEPNLLGDYGNVLSVKKDYDNSIFYLKKACEVSNNAPNHLLNTAKIMFYSGNNSDSIEYAKKLLEKEPDNIEALNLIISVYDSFSPVDSSFYLKKLSRLNNDIRAKISAATTIPLFFKSQNEIDIFRAGFEEKVDYFLSDKFIIDNHDEKKMINIVSFYLAYHARNNKILKQKIANLMYKVMPYLDIKATHISNYKFDKNRKIKLGFISTYFHKHPVSMCFNGIIQ